MKYIVQNVIRIRFKILITYLGFAIIINAEIKFVNVCQHTQIAIKLWSKRQFLIKLLDLILYTIYNIYYLLILFKYVAKSYKYIYRNIKVGNSQRSLTRGRFVVDRGTVGSGTPDTAGTFHQIHFDNNNNALQLLTHINLLTVHLGTFMKTITK